VTRNVRARKSSREQKKKIELAERLMTANERGQAEAEVSRRERLRLKTFCSILNAGLWTKARNRVFLNNITYVRVLCPLTVAFNLVINRDLALFNLTGHLGE
jgi:hypothetical protein